MLKWRLRLSRGTTTFTFLTMIRMKKVVVPVLGVVTLFGVVVFMMRSDTNVDTNKLKSVEAEIPIRKPLKADDEDKVIQFHPLSSDTSTDTGTAVVYRHNGKDLERIPDFCTWTLPMDCASLKIPDHDPMTIYIHDIRDDPGLSGILKKSGTRDPENVKIVMNELAKYPDAGFFDFGSHISVYGLSIAHATGRKVVAIDPMIENIMRVCKSVQLNKLSEKFTIVYNALSNEIVKVNFNRVFNHIGATTVIKNKEKTDQCDDTDNYSVTLDDLLPIIPFKSAVMKLDVEKSEYLTITGARKFLEEINVHSILMEWYNIVKTPHGGPLVDLMKELKYVPYIPYANGNHKRVEYNDYKKWSQMKNLLDILWVKEG